MAYAYYKDITISDASGAGTNYQVMLKIGESSGSTGYDFHLEGHSENFPSGKGIGGDLKFTNSTGETSYDFWVEDVSGTSPNRTAIVWVEVQDDLSITNQTIRCYYGDASAPDLSNGDNTFMFFDDFSGTTLDTNKWDYIGSPVVNNELQLSCSSGKEGVLGKEAFSVGKALRVRTDLDNLEGLNRYGLSNSLLSNNFAIDDAAYFYRGHYITNDGDCVCRNEGSGSDVWFDETTGEFVYDILWLSGSVKFLKDGVEKANITTNIPNENLKVRLENEYHTLIVTFTIKWVLLRKYTDPEPAFSSASSEQPVAISFTISDTISLSDNQTATRQRLFNVSDTINLSDTTSAIRVKIFEVLDTIGLTDAISALRMRVASVIDKIKLTEIVNVRRLWEAITKHTTSWTNKTKHTTSWTNKSKS